MAISSQCFILSTMEHQDNVHEGFHAFSRHVGIGFKDSSEVTRDFFSKSRVLGERTVLTYFQVLVIPLSGFVLNFTHTKRALNRATGVFPKY